MYLQPYKAINVIVGIQDIGFKNQNSRLIIKLLELSLKCNILQLRDNLKKIMFYSILGTLSKWM